MDHTTYQKYRRLYKRTIWLRIRSISHSAHMWLHVFWVLFMAIVGGLLGALIDSRMSWGGFEVAPWVAGIVGGLLAFLLGSTIVLLILWRQASIEEYASGQIMLGEKDGEIRALSPNSPSITIELEEPSVNNVAALAIKNSGAGTEIEARISFEEGEFQPKPQGLFLLQWMTGGYAATLPKGGKALLQFATIDRTTPHACQWTIKYGDHGTTKTTRLSFSQPPGISTFRGRQAGLEIELICNPEMSGGPIRKRVAIQGCSCHVEESSGS